MPKLIYHDSSGIEKEMGVGAEPLIIGRATECQIQTQDAMVSRRHARIVWDGNYWIEDLGSSNGVFVGNERVQRAPFRPGDTVTCGSLVLRLVPDTSVKSTKRPDGKPVKVKKQTAQRATLPPPEPVAPMRVPSPLPKEPHTSTAAPSAVTGRPERELVRELEREQKLRSEAEQAVRAVTERARAAEARVIELDSEIDRLKKVQPAGGTSRASEAQAADAAIALGDAVAELRASLRVARDEVRQLTAPAPSVEVVADALRAALDQLEDVRAKLRALGKLLGVA